jgi:hypothetical protein
MMWTLEDWTVYSKARCKSHGQEICSQAKGNWMKEGVSVCVSEMLGS